MTGDSEFSADLWFIASSGNGIAGVALCWTSSFVKDIAVDAGWRHHGLGTALLLHCCTVYSRPAGRRRSTSRSTPRTHPAPCGSTEQLGFRVIERIPM